MASWKKSSMLSASLKASQVQDDTAIPILPERPAPVADHQHQQQHQQVQYALGSSPVFSRSMSYLVRSMGNSSQGQRGSSSSAVLSSIFGTSLTSGMPAGHSPTDVEAVTERGFNVNTRRSFANRPNSSAAQGSWGQSPSVVSSLGSHHGMATAAAEPMPHHAHDSNRPIANAVTSPYGQQQRPSHPQLQQQVVSPWSAAAPQQQLHHPTPKPAQLVSPSVLPHAGSVRTVSTELDRHTSLTAPLMHWHHEAEEAASPATTLSQQHQLSPATSPGPWSPSTPSPSGAPAAATDGTAAAAGAQHQGPEPVGADDGGVLKALSFGLINTAVGLPALVAFAAIVFQSPIYSPYLGSLCKFFFLSSAIHQLVFCIFSSLPFAIGQVQDVGIIFLSAMATSISYMCSDQGLGPEVALGTSLLTMTLATMCVGLGTIAVGRFKLANLVQYVPLPVVGGYLGYVGYFCVAGGIALGTSTQVDTLVSWVNIFTRDAALKLLPTLSTCGVLMLTLEHVRHPLALPAVLCAVPAAFHAVLWAAGVSLAQAQEAGWVMPPTEGGQYFWQLWGMFNIRGWSLSGIYFPAMFAQLPKLLGLFLVVCFGSCMDVAAIQQDITTPLDFDRELMTVGISNTVTGLLGVGYTGSYIFSQTVFTMRAGVMSRVNGLLVAALEAAVFALPFSVVQYMPNFFFGALLLWFGIEISRDWLFLSYRKLSSSEYLLLWATFMAIMATDLERGIAAGIVMAVLYFAREYAVSQVGALRVVAASSGAVHSYEAAALLELVSSERITTLALSGFVFFGSSISLSNAVTQVADRMVQEVEDSVLAAQHALQGTQPQQRPVQVKGRDLSKKAPAAASSLPALTQAPPAPQLPQSLPTRGTPGPAAAAAAAAAEEAPVTPAKMLSRGSGSSASLGGEAAGEQSSGLQWARTIAAMADAPLFMILDFKQVSNVDATGARTFGTLVNALSARGFNLVFANICSPHAAAIRRLLQAHGIELRMQQQAEAADEAAAPGGYSPPRAEGVAGEGAYREQLPGDDRQQQQDPLLHLPPGCCAEFPTLEAAVRWCECVHLNLGVQRGLLPPQSEVVTLRELLDTHAQEMPSAAKEESAVGGVPNGTGAGGDSEAAGRPAHVAERLAPFVTRRKLLPGQRLFRAGQLIDELYIVEEGTVMLTMAGGYGAVSSAAALLTGSIRGLDGSSRAAGRLIRGAAGGVPTTSTSSSQQQQGGARTLDYGPGTLVAAHEFYLQRPAAATAVCTSQRGCTVLSLTRAALSRLMREDPGAVATLHHVAMRATCLDLTAAMDLMERNSSYY